MPLNTEILRDGEPRIVPWDYFTLSCMYTVAVKEGAPDYVGLLNDDKTFGELEEGEWIDFSMAPIYYLEVPGCDLINKGRQTVKQRHVFKRGDDEELVFEPGDVLRAYRTHKS